MAYYGAREIASSFRTVRNNTLKIAEEIPEEKYSFRPAEGSRSVAQTLFHISNLHRFTLATHRDRVRNSMEGFDFIAFVGPIQEHLIGDQPVKEFVRAVDPLGEN